MCDNTSSKALSMKTMHLSHLMRMLHEERMREMDPAASPGRVLAFLRLAGEAPVGDMAMVLGARPRSMENTLSKLVEEGFVSREQGEDKRLDRVKLTEKGADPKNMPEGRVSKVFGALTEEERGQLASILDKLNAGFEKELDLPEDPKERRAAMCQRSSVG
ncbi:MAG: hypothetical protein E7Z68_09960 [Thermoplasmata archaeon]|nr:hypothetical protein [Thermoplasmata archaeon]